MKEIDKTSHCLHKAADSTEQYRHFRQKHLLIGYRVRTLCGAKDHKEGRLLVFVLIKTSISSSYRDRSEKTLPSY
jgi:hypothetical protein